MTHPIRIPSAEHFSRPMHFVDGYAGVTVCDKETSRVRMTYSLRDWDNPMLAAGRRCKACESWVSRVYPDRVASREREG
jgi:hypothetical protein